jgi:hypothetical protein
VKVAVERLCRRETNLLDADITLQFAITQLEKQSSELGKTLAASLRTRVKERRTDLSGLLQYLSNPAAKTSCETFTVPSSAASRKLIHSLLQRLEGSNTGVLLLLIIIIILIRNIVQKLITICE